MRSGLGAAATRSACRVLRSNITRTNNKAIALADFQRRLAASSFAIRTARVWTSTSGEFIGTSWKNGPGHPLGILDENRFLREHKSADCVSPTSPAKPMLIVSPVALKPRYGGKMLSRFLRLGVTGFLAAALFCTPAFPQGKGHGKGKGHNKHQDEDDRGEGGKYIFRAHDREVITRYYSGRGSGLPPGLAKRGGNLPPGL